MKTSLFSLIFSLITVYSFGQLSAGDIAFIGFNEDAGPSAGQDHSFSWISLTDIPAGEVIYFTEQGVNINSMIWFANSEGHYSWTAPAGGLSCGTVVHVYENGSTDILVASSGTMSGILSGSSWNLSGGDQVIAYQAASAAPAISSATFISGIHKENDLTTGETNSWTSTTYNATGVSYSHLPPGLTNGVNCISVFDASDTEYNNVKYTGSLVGNSVTLRTAINTKANWSVDLSDVTAYDISPAAYSPNVTCTLPCTDPDIPTITASQSTVCEGANAILTISGNLNDATQWIIYTGSCGGTQIGTTSGSTFVVSPNVTTTYYVHGEGGCVTPGTCGSEIVAVNSMDNAAFSYSASAFCVNASDPIPTISGLGGGTFTSSPAGLSINASTGQIDVSASTPNSYTITYTTAGACPNSSNVNVTINALDNASFNYDASSYCVNASDPTPTITGLGGGTFTSSPAGLSINTSTGQIDVSTSTPNTYTVTYTTSGTCSNSSNVNVTVVSPATSPLVISPVNVCPGDDIILNATGSGVGVINYYNSNPTLLGTVSMPPAATSYNAGVLSNGSYTFYATEVNGCESTPSTIIVNVGDATPPSTVCQNITVYLDGSGNVTITPGDIDDGSSDNCGLASLSASQMAFTCADIGANSVTLTSTDGSGNSSSCVAVVTVMDTVSPTPDVASLSDITAECQLASLVAPIATDNCVGSITGTHNVTLPITGQGTTVVTWTYDDGNGNTSTQTQNVVINDNTAPVADIVTLSDVTEECIVTTLTAPTATDNCSGTITGTHDVTLPIIMQGTTVVTWTYDDGNGNTSTQTQNVVINDITAPVPDISTLSSFSGECEVTPTAPTATDNCIGTITGTPDVSFPITTQGTTVVTWTYDDGNGNISTQTQDIIVSTINVGTLTAHTPTSFIISANASGYTYQWIENCGTTNDQIVGETNQTFTTTSNGTFAVIISNGVCSDTSDCIIIDELGVEAIQLTDKINVYPNPTNGLINVESKNAINEIQVFNGLGQQISVYKLNGSLEYSFDIKSVSGVYFMKINTDIGQEIIYIVKQ